MCKGGSDMPVALGILAVLLWLIICEHWLILAGVVIVAVLLLCLMGSGGW